MATSPRIQDQNVSILVEFALKPLDLINERLQCNYCDVWYHVKCMQMSTQVYEALANSSCIWECVVCGLPNFSSSLFKSSTIQATNYFWSLDLDLSDTRHNESILTNQISRELPSSTLTPKKTSSLPSAQSAPKNHCLRLLNVDF